MSDVLIPKDRETRPQIQDSGEDRIEICPVCGAECVQEKCKIVCVSDACVHRVVMNCSEF